MRQGSPHAHTASLVNAGSGEMSSGANDSLDATQSSAGFNGRYHEGVMQALFLAESQLTPHWTQTLWGQLVVRWVGNVMPLVYGLSWGMLTWSLQQHAVVPGLQHFPNWFIAISALCLGVIFCLVSNALLMKCLKRWDRQRKRGAGWHDYPALKPWHRIKLAMVYGVLVGLVIFNGYALFGELLGNYLLVVHLPGTVVYTACVISTLVWMSTVMLLGHQSICALDHKLSQRLAEESPWVQWLTQLSVVALPLALLFLLVNLTILHLATWAWMLAVGIASMTAVILIKPRLTQQWEEIVRIQSEAKDMPQSDPLQKILTLVAQDGDALCWSVAQIVHAGAEASVEGAGALRGAFPPVISPQAAAVLVTGSTSSMETMTDSAGTLKDKNRIMAVYWVHCSDAKKEEVSEGDSQDVVILQTHKGQYFILPAPATMHVLVYQQLKQWDVTSHLVIYTNAASEHSKFSSFDDDHSITFEEFSLGVHQQLKDLFSGKAQGLSAGADVKTDIPLPAGQDDAHNLHIIQDFVQWVCYLPATLRQEPHVRGWRNISLLALLALAGVWGGYISYWCSTLLPSVLMSGGFAPTLTAVLFNIPPVIYGLVAAMALFILGRCVLGLVWSHVAASQEPSHADVKQPSAPLSLGKQKIIETCQYGLVTGLAYITATVQGINGSVEFIKVFHTPVVLSLIFILASVLIEPVVTRTYLNSKKLSKFTDPGGYLDGKRMQHEVAARIKDAMVSPGSSQGKSAERVGEPEGSVGLVP